MNRKKLVEALEELLSDEFDSSELVYLNDEELVNAIIEAALFYKYENN
jgi:hypothetical protein